MYTTTPIRASRIGVLTARNDAVRVCYLDDRDWIAVTSFALLCGSFVDDFPDAASFIVGDVNAAVGSLREPGRTMRCGVRLLVRSSEAICEDLGFRGVDWLTPRIRNEYDEVTFLWSWRPVP
jgi:hypothetical protein